MIILKICGGYAKKMCVLEVKFTKNIYKKGE